MNLEDLYRLLRSEHVQAQGIVDTVPDSLLVLGQDLCVLSASRAFFETFRVGRDETLGRPLYELGNGQWDIPELRYLLEQVIPRSTAVIDYEVRHDFLGVGRRTMLLSARRLFHPDNNSATLLLSIEDAGFCEKGEGGRWVEEHDMTFRGDWPMNTHGGQLSFGQSGFAGGMSHVTEAYLQLAGRADERQLRKCDTAFVNGNGGIMSEQVSLILQGA